MLDFSVRRTVFLVVIGLSVSACKDEPQSMEMANPASEYCASQGGETEMRTGPMGEVGYCIFPDGRVVDEWEFYSENS